MSTVIEQILLDLRTDRFIIDLHAIDRMALRQVTREDISNLGYNGVLVEKQKYSRYLISGFDLDGDELSVVVEFKTDSVIITVME